MRLRLPVATRKRGGSTSPIPRRSKSVVNEVAAHFGSLDIIVNNAGISVRVAIDDPT